MPPPADSRLRAEVLGLLEERHGIGSRGARCPAWMQARLDQALDALGTSLGLGSDALAKRLRRQSGDLEDLAELLRVGETSFYRDPAQWNALADAVLPAFRGLERCRALSAGCGTGEEAWTLAMLLDQAAASSRTGKRAPTAGYRVVGQDRSGVALAAAQGGRYPARAARYLPHALGRRYLVDEGGSVRVADQLPSQVSFVLRDLMLGPPPGHYEIIVCKNLLIYFGEDAGRRLLSLLMRALAEEGVLVVARSEVARVRALGHSGEEIAPGVTVFRR
jgi:chemotaxis methyl-accepting protein methylase